MPIPELSPELRHTFKAGKGCRGRALMLKQGAIDDRPIEVCAVYFMVTYGSSAGSDCRIIGSYYASPWPKPDGTIGQRTPSCPGITHLSAEEIDQQLRLMKEQARRERREFTFIKME